MPAYKVTALSYLNDRLVQEGETVEYDGLPGSNLEPLDDEGRARKAKAYAARGTTATEAARLRGVLIAGGADLGDNLARDHSLAKAPPPASITTHHVAIPEGWRDMEWQNLVKLAGRLGAPETLTKKAAAIEYIEAEEARRTPAPASDGA